ncbi:MAG: Hsp20/alpha crystallin family protein [bacterium]
MKKERSDFFSIDVVIGEAPSLYVDDASGSKGYFSPQMDVYENKKGIFVEMELPGVSNEDIKVSLIRDKLVIRGVKKSCKREEKVKYYLLERPYGVFEKVMELPSHIDRNSIEATFKDGILVISMRYKKEKALKID